jgi:hypothetical protein
MGNAGRTTGGEYYTPNPFIKTTLFASKDYRLKPTA